MNITGTSSGKESIEYADALLNLARVYKLMGDYTNAEPHFKSSLTLRKKLAPTSSQALFEDYVTNLQSLADMKGW